MTRKGLHWTAEDSKANEKYIRDYKDGKIETIRLDARNTLSLADKT